MGALGKEFHKMNLMTYFWYKIQSIFIELKYDEDNHIKYKV